MKKICFIGAGNMAGAIINGISQSDLKDSLEIIVCDTKEDTIEHYNKLGFQAYLDVNQAIANADYVVISVKPQSVESLSKIVKQDLLVGKTLVSIAAGITCERLLSFFPQVADVVRLMPNTPALVSKGVTGIYYHSADFVQDKKEFVASVFSTIGSTVTVEKEDDINLIIAASGSGPAYFFYIFNNLIKGLVDLGLAEEQAKQLVLETASGAISMVEFNKNLDLQTLQDNVTSKGGTTQAALETFIVNNIGPSLQKGVIAAYERAKELEKTI